MGSGRGKCGRALGVGWSAGSEVQGEALRLTLKTKGSAVCPAASPLTRVTPVAWLQHAMADGDVGSLTFVSFPDVNEKVRWPCLLV